MDAGHPRRRSAMKPKTMKRFLLLVFCLLPPMAHALVLVTGTGTLKCSDWLKAREEKNEVQTSLIVQWIAGFAVAHNYYVSSEKKQLRIDLDQIQFSLDKYCRDNPLTPMLITAAAEYVQ